MAATLDPIQSADYFNKTGGDHVKANDYCEATKMFTRAIELNPSKASYYSNRSLCHQKLENYGLAISDATKSIELDQDFYKAYYRRAISYFFLGQMKQALNDFDILRQKYPSNKDINEKYSNCLKVFNQQQFAAAIKCIEKSSFDDIDIDTLNKRDPNCELFIDDFKIDQNYIISLIKYLKSEKLLPVRELYKNGKLTVCGDVHGQFYDLCHIFEINGYPSSTNHYLFNGDFVDRGSFSVEIMITLLTFTVLYPHSFLMNRGNHETIEMNKMYGFQQECVKKYSSTALKMFQELFRLLPISHLIDDKVFVTHGGLPSTDVTLNDIEAIDRNREPPNGTTMFDLMWSDPQQNNGLAPSPRGIGSVYGPDITERFCKNNNLKFVIRSHEAQMEGFNSMHDGKCLTIFSAPNYCDEMGNKGAFIVLKKDLEPNVVKFEASPHPQAEKFTGLMM